MKTYGIAAAGTGNKIMRATVCRVPGTRKYTVWIVQGVQSFQLDYKATKGECNSMAEMFERALDANEAKAVRRLIPLEDTILPSSVYNDRLSDAGTSRAAMRRSAAALKRKRGPMTTCTRPKPHTCRVNGPCNGWPREVPSDMEILGCGCQVMKGWRCPVHDGQGEQYEPLQEKGTRADLKKQSESIVNSLEVAGRKLCEQDPDLVDWLLTHARPIRTFQIV